MARIAILTPHIIIGDAISNDCIGMYRVLHRLGYEVRVYASDGTFTEPKAWPANKIKNFLKNPRDVLIYHYSMGWDFGLELLRMLPCRKIVKYHNITPPEFFAGWSAEYEAVCRHGRQQLKAVAQTGCDLFLSDSAYNMQELLAAGAAGKSNRVVPPFHHIDHLLAVEADISVLDAYRDEYMNVLMVGRVSPNKNHHGLIEAFAAYYHDYNARSRLLIVGKERSNLAGYSRSLRGLIQSCAVDDAVVWAGEVSDRALKAYYLVANAFMILSEHEGFCVPLVEAMAIKLPIIAYASSAIPETIGEGGLVWTERDPYLFAESLRAIASDERTSVALGMRGHARYERRFTNSEIEANFIQAVSEFL